MDRPLWEEEILPRLRPDKPLELTGNFSADNGLKLGVPNLAGSVRLFSNNLHLSLGRNTLFSSAPITLGLFADTIGQALHAKPDSALMTAVSIVGGIFFLLFAVNDAKSTGGNGTKWTPERRLCWAQKALEKSSPEKWLEAETEDGAFFDDADRGVIRENTKGMPADPASMHDWVFSRDLFAVDNFKILLNRLWMRLDKKTIETLLSDIATDKIDVGPIIKGLDDWQIRDLHEMRYYLESARSKSLRVIIKMTKGKSEWGSEEELALVELWTSFASKMSKYMGLIAILLEETGTEKEIVPLW